MATQFDVNETNSMLLKPDSTKEAAALLDEARLPQIIQHFNEFDPYVQAIFIQSIIYLNSNQYEAIKNSYQQLLQEASQSKNDWVLATYKIFKNYPQIMPTQRITTEIPRLDVEFEEMNPWAPPPPISDAPPAFNTTIQIKSRSEVYAQKPEQRRPPEEHHRQQVQPVDAPSMPRREMPPPARQVVNIDLGNGPDNNSFSSHKKEKKEKSKILKIIR